MRSIRITKYVNKFITTSELIIKTMYTVYIILNIVIFLKLISLDCILSY